MRVYKFGEFDLYNQREEDGLVSIDGTVFVSDGGYFKGIVQDHGTLIVRGGEADVIIGQNGKVSAVGGKLHAVVDLNGQLDISEGTVEVEEQGGLVRIVQSYARITFLKSVVKGKTIDQFASAHDGTTFLGCNIKSTGVLNLHRRAEFYGADRRLSRVDGQILGEGDIRDVYVSKTGSINCMSKCILKRCVIDGGDVLVVDPLVIARNIIVRKGKLRLRSDTTASCITMEGTGILEGESGSIATVRNRGGKIESRGKVIYLKN